MIEIYDTKLCSDIFYILQENIRVPKGSVADIHSLIMDEISKYINTEGDVK
jgi:hypothetical protein